MNLTKLLLDNTINSFRFKLKLYPTTKQHNVGLKAWGLNVLPTVLSDKFRTWLLVVGCWFMNFELLRIFHWIVTENEGETCKGVWGDDLIYNKMTVTTTIDGLPCCLRSLTELRKITKCGKQIFLMLQMSELAIFKAATSMWKLNSYGWSADTIRDT